MIFLTAGAGATYKKNPVASGVISFIYLFIWILAIVMSLQCNPAGAANRIWPILGAIFFPEIYLVQFAVRRYLIKEAGYCPRIRFGGM